MKLKLQLFKAVALGCATLFAALAPAADFEWTAAEKTSENRLELTLQVAPDAYVYADSLEFSTPPHSAPTAAKHFDPLFNREISAYTPGSWSWTFSPIPPEVSVHYMGCGGSICYPPDTYRWSRENDGGDGAEPETAAAPTVLPEFTVVRAHSGMLDAAEMRKFLEDNDIASPKEGGFSATGLMLVLAVFAGGILLNLTPCVLPLIPVNLAILSGGGKRGGLRGLAAGACYGLGMATAYGALGLTAALAGTAVGAVNTSAWFNFLVAAVFAVLSMAMFGVFSIDFSRYSSGFGDGLRKLKYPGIFLFGALTALLAGACVAPAVIAVLVLATNGGMYALLPFVLGLGLALPWTLAGAGLGVLPKAGAWMRHVKRLFGVIIALVAVWYAALGATLLAGRSGYSEKREVARLAAALDEGAATGRPVFIDVWSSSCKNCLYMDVTTFKDPEVEELLKGFVVLKYQIEDYSSPAAVELLRRLDSPGLPTVAVIRKGAGENDR